MTSRCLRIASAVLLCALPGCTTTYTQEEVRAEENRRIRAEVEGEPPVGTEGNSSNVLLRDEAEASIREAEH